MTKALYFVMLVVEFMVGFGLLALVLVKAKKAADELGKRKAKTTIALFMLLPAVAAIVGFIAVVSNTGW